jgi:hypothetical protein
MKAKYILGLIFVILFTIIYIFGDDKKTTKKINKNIIVKTEKKELKENKNLLTQKEEEYYSNLDENNILKLSEKKLEKIAYTKMQDFLNNFNEIDVKDFNLRTRLYVENDCFDDSEIYIYEKDGVYMGDVNRYIDGLIFGGGPSENFMTTNNTGIQMEEFMKLEDAIEFLNSENIGNFTYKRTTVPKILGACYGGSDFPFYEFVNEDGKIIYMDVTPRYPVGTDLQDFFKEIKPYYWKTEFEETRRKEIANPEPEINPEGEPRRYTKEEFDELINSDIREKRVKAIQSMTGSRVEELVDIINNDPHEDVKHTAIMQISNMEFDSKDIFLDTLSNINTDNFSLFEKEELEGVLTKIKNKNKN